MGQLEDITYAALRRYGVIGEGKTDQINFPTQPRDIAEKFFIAEETVDAHIKEYGEKMDATCRT